MPPTDESKPITGLVLAAGGSQRLGPPKQLLPYGSGPVLAHVLGTARECGFRQLLCVLVFARSMFGELAELHGDKGVWKLLDRYADQVVDVPVDGPIPLDVDTWEDYETVLAAAGGAG